MRAANGFASSGLGDAILVARNTEIEDVIKASGIELHEAVSIHNARVSDRNADYAQFLYERLQRQGFLFSDCQRLVNNDRNIFAACMVAMGDADAMVTGITRNYSVALEDVRQVIDTEPGHRLIGVSMAICRGRTVFVADSAIQEQPNAAELADTAEEAAGVARRFGYEPRVALLSYSTFGHPEGTTSNPIREAVAILDERAVDFEYDGEMSADVALSRAAMDVYPFCRLSEPANVLIMPGFDSASIATKMLQELGEVTVSGRFWSACSIPSRSRH